MYFDATSEGIYVGNTRKIEKKYENPFTFTENN